MELQKGKWYVCIKDWNDDGWVKFQEGDLIQCEHDDQITGRYGITYMFVGDEPEHIFREATETETNIANSTDVDIDDFMEDTPDFDTTDTLIDIYRKGAENMLRHIRLQMNIKGKG